MITIAFIIALVSIRFQFRDRKALRNFFNFLFYSFRRHHSAPYGWRFTVVQKSGPWYFCEANQIDII